MLNHLSSVAALYHRRLFPWAAALSMVILLTALHKTPEAAGAHVNFTVPVTVTFVVDDPPSWRIAIENYDRYLPYFRVGDRIVVSRQCVFSTACSGDGYRRTLARWTQMYKWDMGRKCSGIWPFRSCTRKTLDETVNQNKSISCKEEPISIRLELIHDAKKVLAQESLPLLPDDSVAMTATAPARLGMEPTMIRARPPKDIEVSRERKLLDKGDVESEYMCRERWRLLLLRVRVESQEVDNP